VQQLVNLQRTPLNLLLAGNTLPATQRYVAPGENRIEKVS
jgi:hypothetical protein